MKRFLFLLSGAVLFFATSCLNGTGGGNSSSATYNGVLTVTNTTSGEVSYSDKECSVTVTIPDMLEPKLDILFNGVKFDKMMPALNIAVEGLAFKSTISEDETSINYVFNESGIVPSIGGIKYEKYTIGVIKGAVGRNVDIEFTIPSKDKIVTFKSKSNDTDTTTKEEETSTSKK